MRYIFAFLMLLTLKGHAQYPFEKFSVKKYDSVAFKVVDINHFTQAAVAHYKDYTVKLVRDSGNIHGGKILLYYKKALIKTADGDFGGLDMSEQVFFPLYIEDVNNDGKSDIVFKTYNSAGTGLASGKMYITCFIKKGDRDFQTFKFGSFYQDPQKEYEIAHGQYVIVGQSLAFVKKHSYWLFDLYQYKKGELINVGEKYNYPIAVPYLNKETYKPTNKISKKQLAHLSMRKPDFNSATP